MSFISDIVTSIESLAEVRGRFNNGYSVEDFASELDYLENLWDSGKERMQSAKNNFKLDSAEFVLFDAVLKASGMVVSKWYKKNKKNSNQEWLKDMVFSSDWEEVEELAKGFIALYLRNINR